MIASPFVKGRKRGISKSPLVPLCERGKLKRESKRGEAPLPNTSPLSFEGEGD